MSKMGAANGIKKGVEVQTDTQDARGKHQLNCGALPNKLSECNPCLSTESYLVQAFP